MGHDHPLEVLDEAIEKDHIDDWRFDTQFAKYVAPDGDHLIYIDHDGAVSGYLIELRTKSVS